MKEKPVVIISSTAQDLEKYRALVTDACLRVDMFPTMMEQLPAMNEDGIRASLALVDQADLYVGIFAHRYGYVPKGHDSSITQMEYERAVERKIPRLIFMMDEDVPVLPKDFDIENMEKLKAFKQLLRAEHVVAFFSSPEDLRGLVVDSLTKARTAMDTAREDAAELPTPAALANSIHYVSDIPHPPEPYIAHPYTLLQVRRLVGRKEEMELLTDWVTGKRFEDVRIFNVVAIGGMGKSALTWTWFNDIAPQEMTPSAGRLWWSFYESDATFENFVTRALAYVSRRRLDEVKQLPFSEREDQLRDLLDREPFLLVLDGLERILTAYARLDAAYLRDEDALDEETVNRVAGAYGLPRSAGQSFVGKHKLRMTADPRAGRFLRELARVRASRTLVSTRLYPADLQAPDGSPSPGCSALFLPGLSDQDALELWRAYGARGSREEMLPVFRAFDKHPLLLQLLGYEVAEFREAPGDFDAWKTANPEFNPFGMELANIQSHVLEHALSSLSRAELKTLQVIAGFRMPASIDTLKALLIRTGEEEDPSPKPFATFGDLDRVLTALEDRGLLGWDRHANRYDLHPIVRGVVWVGLNDETRTDLYATLLAHFQAMPMVLFEAVNSVEDLTPAIELYYILTRRKSYEKAYRVFRKWLYTPTQHRLSASHLQVELLNELFADGLDTVPSLQTRGEQSFALFALAQASSRSGRPGVALSLFRLVDEIVVSDDRQRPQIINLAGLSDCLRVAGKLRAAEACARTALVISRNQERHREEVALYRLGLVLAARGKLGGGTMALRASLRMWQAQSYLETECVILARLAEVALWQGDTASAATLANRAWHLVAAKGNKRNFVRAARLQGAAALFAGDHTGAGERLHHALLLARAVSFVEEELPTLVTLAEWHRQDGKIAQARALLEDVWDSAECGPYPLFHADALNVLAQIERDAGNTEAAIEAATKAYRLAWCDGPPFAYHWGLEKAKAHLAALGAPEPEMPPFDESQHEPMPEVEIKFNPPDEFGGDDEDEDRAQ